MNQPYRVFQILPAPMDGRVYLVVDGTGDPATVLQKVLFHLAAPKSSAPFRLEPETMYEHIWDSALDEARKIVHSAGSSGEAYDQISALRFKCDSPSSSSQSSSSSSSSSDGSYHGLERNEMGHDPSAHRPSSPPSTQK